MTHGKYINTMTQSYVDQHNMISIYDQLQSPAYVTHKYKHIFLHVLLD